jgi:hypothetical protein
MDGDAPHPTSDFSQVHGSSIREPADLVRRSFFRIRDCTQCLCAALKKALPRLQGRIILQDRPAVLEGALEVAGMEKMPHNFLTEQPVKSKTSLCVTLLMLFY